MTQHGMRPQPKSRRMDVRLHETKTGLFLTFLESPVVKSLHPSPHITKAKFANFSKIFEDKKVFENNFMPDIYLISHVFECECEVNFLDIGHLHGHTIFTCIQKYITLKNLWAFFSEKSTTLSPNQKKPRASVHVWSKFLTMFCCF